MSTQVEIACQRLVLSINKTFKGHFKCFFCPVGQEQAHALCCIYVYIFISNFIFFFQYFKKVQLNLISKLSMKVLQAYGSHYYKVWFHSVICH